MPGKVPRCWIVIICLPPIRFIRTVLQRRMVNDEIEIRIRQSRLFNILRIRQMTKRPRLIRKSFVSTDQLDSQFTRLLIKPHGIIVIALKAITGLTRVSVAIPLPGIDPIHFHFTLHLLKRCLLIHGVGGFVPVMVRCQIPLAQSTL